jgi:hypothetical protein
MHNKVPNYLYSAGKAGTRTGERGHTRSTARIAEIPRNRDTFNYLGIYNLVLTELYFVCKYNRNIKKIHFARLIRLSRL